VKDHKGFQGIIIIKKSFPKGIKRDKQKVKNNWMSNEIAFYGAFPHWKGGCALLGLTKISKRIIDGFFLYVLVFGVVTGGRGVLYAQVSLPKEPTEQSPLSTQTIQPDPSKFRVGSFLLNPVLTVSELYDDNIFATRKDEQDDFITIISPSLQIQSDWKQHKLNVLSGANIARYANDDLQNYEDYWVEADGRYDLSGRANVFGGARFSHLHIPRTSPNEVFGLKPTIYREIGSHMGIFKRWENVSIRLGGTFERLDFDDVPSNTGEINNDDRDRNSYGAGSRLGYLLSPRYEAFFQGAYDNRTYDAARCCASGGSLFDRNSQGFNIATGLNLKLTDTLTAELLGGYLSQNYADSSLKDVSTVDFGGLFRWRAAPATTVRGFLDRSVEETIVEGASSYVNTQVGARVSHRIEPRLTVNVNFGYSHVDFQGISRLDHVIEGGAGFKYRFHPNFFLTADYQLLHRDSNVRTVDYFQNLVQVGIGGELPASFSTIASKPLETVGNHTDRSTDLTWSGFYADLPWSGFYLGGQAGFGGITSKLSGPRGSGGTLDADFGDHGFTEGAFGGYGITYRQWYVGAEIEGEASQAKWDHNRSLGGRMFSVEKVAEYGGAFRFGYALKNVALLYGRVGFARTEFRTKYNHEGISTSQDDDQTGLRVGGGVEVPMTDHLFGRFDYTYTDYGGAYKVNFGNGFDKFENSETLFRLGVGYRFHEDSPEQLGKIQAPDLSGFYAGAQAGYGTLNTDLDALQTDSGGDRTLAADFGGQGATGSIFAGYGLSWHQWYLGLELEAEASRSSWDHARDPSGRDFSVDKKGGYGASGRLGYVLSNGVLLYGRGGIVRTKFITQYEKGTNTDNWVDDDEKQYGWRVGLGTEIPATERLFLRFDYSYTDYNSYSITTPHTNADTVEFDNRESLFRVGGGVRF